MYFNLKTKAIKLINKMLKATENCQSIIGDQGSELTKGNQSIKFWSILQSVSSIGS